MSDCYALVISICVARYTVHDDRGTYVRGTVRMCAVHVVYRYMSRVRYMFLRIECTSPYSCLLCGNNIINLIILFFLSI